jgi:hypothetical protein
MDPPIHGITKEQNAGIRATPVDAIMARRTEESHQRKANINPVTSKVRNPEAGMSCPWIISAMTLFINKMYFTTRNSTIDINKTMGACTKLRD